eukprot:CAMPEP_0118715078 /NCGR_PEP_ID=MMETSP0800-20121206/26640_1 /TAXON_ID=210618 ORGANISM="Striatella unipunctata, Strain CCMP2910" /NCGR_SAMPLE_ID=MMETSP0800 /ASSEMBLY_ACC=CAM_ASM_000638 /LENGTH=619 /DNA_ID=CAMNT_0006621137 /DNA_START=271 /DNA_END=2130 /DNA_ORIENTATION=-
MPTPAAAALAPETTMLKRKEDLVKRFASQLGASSASSGLMDVGADAILQCISSTVRDSEIVCKLPSLNMGIKKDENTSILPRVGSSRGTQGKIPETDSATESVPSMTASVFKNTGGVSVPIGSSPSSSGPSPHDSANLEKFAASLESPTEWTKSTVTHAPSGMLRNLSSSLVTLVEKRVKEWTLLLLKHSLVSGDKTSRTRLMNLLRTSNGMSLKSSKLSFCTLPLPEGSTEDEELDEEEENADLIFPLLVDYDADFFIQGKTDRIRIKIPGAMAVNFNSNPEIEEEFGITWSRVQVESRAIVEAMIEQARLVVFRAVARATTKSDPIPKTVSAWNSMGLESANEKPDNDGSLIQETRMKKARASAHQLNKILSEPIDPVHPTPVESLPTKTPTVTIAKTASVAILKARSIAVLKDTDIKDADGPRTFTGKQKTRSVTWLTPMQKPYKDTSNWPEAKRLRQSRPSSLMRSTKSFGKPDASYFESVRNATFADFGGRPSGVPNNMSTGRLAGFSNRTGGHESGLIRSQMSYVDKSVYVGRSRVNESFDHPSDQHGLLRRGFPSSLLAPGYSPDGDSNNGAMARTATALESLLLTATGADPTNKTSIAGVSSVSSVTTYGS